MEEILFQFIDTLDQSVKQVLSELESDESFGKLTLSQLQYLEAVGALTYPSISEVAVKLNITRASTTAGVNRLVKMGYLIKTQSEEDKRVYHVDLTSRSRKMVNAKQQAMQNYVSFIQSALGEVDSAKFEQALDTLVNAFQEKQN